MLTRDRATTILRLAFPITIALSSSLVMAIIDLAMVGSLGNVAVAAMGLASFSNMLVVAFVAGIEPAVQGIVARRRGERSTEPKCLPLNAGLLLAVVLGLPLSLLCYFLSPWFLSAVSSDPEVTQVAVPVFQTLSIAIVAAGMINAFEGFWNGMEKPRTYMGVVLMMNCLNIVLNYMLIFGNFGAPALGAPGAALGSAISLFAGVLVNFLLARWHFKRDGFLRVKPEPALVSRLFQMGVPSTFQGFFFSAGFIVFLWIVGQVGTAELAAANVLVRVTMVLTILAMALGMTSATLVSKAVGEGDFAGASRWGWDTGKVGIIGISLLGLPLLLFPELFLSIFLADPDTVALAVVPLQMVAATTGIGSLIYIFSYTLFSLGDGNRVILVSFSTQWIIFLPGAWIFGPYLHNGLLEIWLVQMVYGGIATALITAIWIDGRWKKAKV